MMKKRSLRSNMNKTATSFSSSASDDHKLLGINHDQAHASSLNLKLVKGEANS